MTQQQRLSLSTGIELDVLIEGDPANPPIIFLHGFPESHRTWRHQISHLKGRFYCIAPDQRGYRGSSKPQDAGDYTPDKLTADVFALADALGIQNFTIAGHDWGGAVAWSVALNGQPGGPIPSFAGRVSRAVIANAPHPFLFGHLLQSNRQQRESSQYMRAFRDPANDPLIREKGLTGLLLKSVNWNSSPALEAEERAALLKDWEDRDACFGMLNWYRATPLAVPTMDEPFSDAPLDTSALPKLMIPTLVVWAMDDLALPPCNLDGMEQVVPDVEIERVSDCGHFVIWEKPDAVNAAMDAFLARTS